MLLDHPIYRQSLQRYMEATTDAFLQAEDMPLQPEVRIRTGGDTPEVKLEDEDEDGFFSLGELKRLASHNKSELNSCHIRFLKWMAWKKINT